MPAGHGGAGCGLPEAGVVLQELGPGLVSVPYLSSAVLAVTALLASGNDAAQAELLPQLATGELLAGVLLVAARDEGGARLHRVAAGAPGLTRTAMSVLDATRSSGSSSAGRSDRSRPSSTSARTCS